MNRYELRKVVPSATYLKRNGLTVGVLDGTTDAEDACILAALRAMAEADEEAGFVHTSNGPTKPPYGSPERKAVDEVGTFIEEAVDRVLAKWLDLDAEKKMVGGDRGDLASDLADLFRALMQAQGVLA